VSERECVSERERERDEARTRARERDSEKQEIDLGLLKRLEVSEAAANNFSGSWAPNSLIFHSFITREFQTQLLYDVSKGN